VLHCPFCHGWKVRDQAVGVIGTNAVALHQVMLFRQLTADLVYFQHTAPDPTGEQREQLAALGVEHVAGEVAAVQTCGDALSGVRMADGRVVARRAVAVATGLEARGELLADLGLATAELQLGGIVAGHYLPADPSGAHSDPGRVGGRRPHRADGAGDQCGGRRGRGRGRGAHGPDRRGHRRGGLCLPRPQLGRGRPVSAQNDDNATSGREAEAFWDPHYVRAAPEPVGRTPCWPTWSRRASLPRPGPGLR